MTAWNWTALLCHAEEIQQRTGTVLTGSRTLMRRLQIPAAANASPLNLSRKRSGFASVAIPHSIVIK